MRRIAILGSAGLLGLAAAVWIGNQGSRHVPVTEADELELAAVPQQWERVADHTFATWFPRQDLQRMPRSCQERGADPVDYLPPTTHRLLVTGPQGETQDLSTAQDIETLFRKSDLRARFDDELRDLAYLALFLLRQQHAELTVAPEVLFDIGPDGVILPEPDLSERRRIEEVAVPGPSLSDALLKTGVITESDIRELRLVESPPVATPLPDSDIFDKHSYEIEENLDGSTRIRGQRLTLGTRVFEVSVHFTRDGRLERLVVVDTGEIIDLSIYGEREFMLVEG